MAINNIGREKESTGREKKAFAVTVPTIFVRDCVREEFEALDEITRLVYSSYVCDGV